MDKYLGIKGSQEMRVLKIDGDYSGQCSLLKSCEKEHSYPNAEKFAKLFTVGRLICGKPICHWCLLNLEDMVKPTLTSTGDDVFHLEELKVRYPNYWKVVLDEGEDNVRNELKRTWTEVEPAEQPEKKKKRPTLEMG